MALGNKRILALGLELSQYQRGIGRKRPLISSNDEIEDSDFNSPLRRTSSKKLCDGQSRELEDLPQDILVKIICGVEHEDLKQLFLVSKAIREAALFAKQSHFAYTTPRKTSVFHNGGLGLVKPFNVEDCDEEIEAPGPPLQKRYRLSRINCNEDNSGVSVALFN